MAGRIAKEGVMDTEQILDKLITWANDRKSNETANRPDYNIHKKILMVTWDQVISKLEEAKRRE